MTSEAHTAWRELRRRLASSNADVIDVDGLLMLMDSILPEQVTVGPTIFGSVRVPDGSIPPDVPFGEGAALT